MSKKKKTMDENFFIRYKNRKLYSLAISSYVTLDRLFTKIESGQDVTIIDRATDADITGISLAREAVTYYAQKMRLAPSVDQVRELIKMIKSWEVKESSIPDFVEEKSNGGNNKKRNEVKDDKDPKHNIGEEIHDVTEHDVTEHVVTLPVGVGNIKALSENTLDESNKAMQYII